MHLVIPYSPRAIFIPYHKSDKRFSVTVAHRRAGKTVARVNKLVEKAVKCQLPNPRFGYVAPFYVQAKDIAWQYLKMYLDPIIRRGGKVNESELSITLPHNNATIRLYGAENAERMRGLYFDGLALDEAQGFPKHVLTAIILPTLADRKGWLDCAGTPRGWSNLLGEIFKLSKVRSDDWFSQVLKASETGIIPEEELETLKAIMSENEYEQEFECSFDAAITGAIYGRQISIADKEGRIRHVEIIKGVPIHTAWDLGYDDATAVWFFQIVGARELHILGYLEEFNQDIKFHCDAVHNWFAARKLPKQAMGKHFVPHDAANKLLAAGGRSIVQQAHTLGIKMFVVKATSQQNSIEALRKTLEYCWFDEKECDQGLDALRQYQYKFDEGNKIFSSKPLHDWASHAADAMEIIGQVWRAPKEEAAKKKKPKFFNDLTAAEVFDLEGKYSQATPYDISRI
jgi:phage terminase large subunit